MPEPLNFRDNAGYVRTEIPSLSLKSVAVRHPGSPGKKRFGFDSGLARFQGLLFAVFQGRDTDALLETTGEIIGVGKGQIIGDILHR